MTRRALAQEELEARALELSRQVALDAAPRGEQESLLVLRLGAEAYGIRASSVQEVVAKPAIAPLPLVPRLVAGVMNLRGELVAVLDLAEVFGPAAPSTRRFAVVARHDDLVAAVLADEVQDVERFAADSREPVLATVAGEVSGFFSGVFRAGDRLVSAIDLAKVFAHPELLKLRKAPEAS
ncbi:MAG: purine-binding chemotaxis protein CheW [Elusimicrobia bacterium]|nr:purine-binding chemotaxis protein CheW [Elusimicrobiota bacterium]